MAFKRYDPKMKEMILKAATESRASGKTWAEAHTAAKAVGYKGSPEGLDVMIRNTKQKIAKSKPKSATTIKTVPPSTKLTTKKSGGVTRYDPKIKAAIIEAANSARSQGKTWERAHAAAKDAGYTGSVQGIVKLLRSPNKKTKNIKKKRGVVAQIENKPPVAKTSVAINGYDPVHAMIDKIVKEKVRAVVDKAIAELRKAVE